MIRSALLVVVAAAVFPATASAARFGESPFETVRDGVSCLRATGVPGELAAWAPDGARFLHATPGGLVATGAIRLGPPTDCPVAAAQPNGAAVVASGVATKDATELAIALREPGADFGVPQIVRRPKGEVIIGLAAAISASGDAVVVWRDLRIRGNDIDTTVRAARRRAGGAFGPLETLDAGGSFDVMTDVNAGIGADGGAVAVWGRAVAAGSRSHTSAMSAIAEPGARFGAPVRLAAHVDGPVALAVTPDGRALAAMQAEGGVSVTERSPGAGFGPLQNVGRGTFGVTPPAVALRPDGAALIAWGGDAMSGVGAVMRTGPGTFGPPIEIVRGSEPAGFGESFTDVIVATTGHRSAPGRPDDSEGGNLRAALAPDGRAVLTWAQERIRGGIRALAPRVATLTPGGAIATQTVGGPLRDPESVAPTLLDSGVPAIAWGDNARPDGGDGRLHLAVDGIADPASQPFPQVTVGAPERTVLRTLQPLVLPVTCAAACDVRAFVHGVGATASLARAGSARLVFGTRSLGVAPLRAAPVPITVASGPPGAVSVETQVVRPRLRRIPEPPLPRIIGPRARRGAGKTVDVRWSTDKASPGVYFSVVAISVRGNNSGETSSFGNARGGERRSFHVRLRGVPASVHYVQVLELRESDGRSRSKMVRIH